MKTEKYYLYYDLVDYGRQRSGPFDSEEEAEVEWEELKRSGWATNKSVVKVT